MTELILLRLNSLPEKRLYKYNYSSTADAYKYFKSEVHGTLPGNDIKQTNPCPHLLDISTRKRFLLKKVQLVY